MNDILMQHAPWELNLLVGAVIAAALALSTPLNWEPLVLAVQRSNNPVEDRTIMPSATRQQTGEHDIPEAPPISNDDTIGDLKSLVSPKETGAFLTQEDVDHLTTELLRVSSDLTIDLARNGTAGRNDALMRADVASRLTGVATVILDRARTTP